MAHDCPRDGTPAFGCSACYGHLKAKALNGGRDKLSESELEFVGATVHVHDASGGWRQATDAVGLFEELSPEDSAMLAALMDVDVPGRDRLEFLA